MREAVREFDYTKNLNDSIHTSIDFYKDKSDKLHEKCASLEAELEQGSTLQAKCASLEAESGQARADLEQARAECAQLRIYQICYRDALTLLQGDNQNKDKSLVRELKDLFGVGVAQVTQ